VIGSPIMSCAGFDRALVERSAHGFEIGEIGGMSDISDGRCQRRARLLVGPTSIVRAFATRVSVALRLGRQRQQPSLVCTAQ